MNRSGEIKEVAAALAAAQAEFQAVPKTSENPFFKSKYASLPDIVLSASPILTSHGLSVSQFPDFDGEHDLLTTILMHESGQWLQASARLHPVKDDPQAQGSAMTYMRRYAYAGCLGLVADEDDDGNRASRRTEPEPTTESRPPEMLERIEGLRLRLNAMSPEARQNVRAEMMAGHLSTQLLHLSEDELGVVEKLVDAEETANDG